MEEIYEDVISLKRHLNTIEHMIYVSCKFTRTTEMLKSVMESIVVGYEKFFIVAYELFVGEDVQGANVHHKIQMLNESMANRGISIDLSDYFLLKRLLLSDTDSIGQYRKNLTLIAYIDGEEYSINVVKLLEFYENLKLAYSALKPADKFSMYNQ